jgi:type I restriction enzyme R subunit
LRFAIKLTLRKYGYPPDIQKLATDPVMKQAGAMAEEIATQA